MNLIDKINKIISKHRAGEDICNWLWGRTFRDIPRSIYRIDHEASTFPLQEYLKIDMLIQEADLHEVLESESNYIIECKKWMQNNNLQDEWTKVYNKKVR